MTNGDGRAWQVLYDLPYWHPAFHYGAPVVLGWVREQAGGPVRVLAGSPAPGTRHPGTRITGRST